MAKTKPKKEPAPEDKLVTRLDGIQELLENLFILEAVDSNVPVEEIRKILKIDKKRINAISKHVKED